MWHEPTCSTGVFDAFLKWSKGPLIVSMVNGQRTSAPDLTHWIKWRQSSDADWSNCVRFISWKPAATWSLENSLDVSDLTRLKGRVLAAQTWFTDILDGKEGWRLFIWRMKGVEWEVMVLNRCISQQRCVHCITLWLCVLNPDNSYVDPRYFFFHQFKSWSYFGRGCYIIDLFLVCVKSCKKKKTLCFND